MNPELKEKIYNMAKKHSECAAGKRDKWNCEADFTVGAAIMYAELAPLVEWVSVKDRLPENQDIVLIKTDKNCILTAYLHGKESGFITYGDDAFIDFGNITHWRKIEL